ncbi:BamA/TamA family outer membrane protein [Fulvivirga sediminis]|uniref:Bacterial surface antigen (D15) domain-containing protein n=1 Tax=Fulvivirga sediminis TaxID=2803949 RepID=A0A937K0L5_9BACT|nr:hypothetical protein [Fulvivirga sediminis]MBL3657759.1 hypothetical protein [Fulvivirga sediminis]
MKVAVITCLLTKRNMDVDTRHYYLYAANLRFLIGICLFLISMFNDSAKLMAQRYNIEYSSSEEEEKSDLSKYFPAYLMTASDTSSIQLSIKTALEILIYEGYLNAKVEHLNWQDSLLSVTINKGKVYEWAYLDEGNVPEVLLSKAGFRERFYIQRPFKVKEIKNVFKKVIAISENSGYPFASIRFDSLGIEDNKVKAILNYDSGPVITYDSLIINADVPVKAAWLAKYLRITYGKSYNQKEVTRIAEKIEALPYLNLEQLPVITFQNDQARINLNLKYNKSNAIDGVVGFLPNAQNDGKLLVTGQFEMRLENLFRAGKSFQVEWQRLRPESQLLDLAVGYPNLFNTPINMNLGFNLLREDSTFINRNALIDFNYDKGRTKFGFFTELRSSRTFTSETIVNDSVADFNLTYYGLNYNYRNYSLNRAKRVGVNLGGSAAVGSKKIQENGLAFLDTAQSVSPKSIQYRLNLDFGYYFKMGRYLGLSQKISAGKLINRSKLYLNDLFRLGGLNTLRGFNENNFFASDYLLSNLQFEFYYAEESFLYLFYDQSFVNLQLSSANGNTSGYPYGIGAGLNLYTGKGHLNLAYALGHSDTQPLSLRLSKFHFGYVAKF